jgi:hypothetical protein
MTAAPTDRIETTSCGRCGGCGRYSYNQVNGSRCFGCGGSGKVDTPRGAAARAFLRALREQRADAFVEGDLVQHDLVSPYAIAKSWATVSAIEPTEQRMTVNGVESVVPMVTFTLTSKGGATRLTTDRSTMMRKGFDGPTKQEQLREALAFQATLDPRGRPLRSAA